MKPDTHFDLVGACPGLQLWEGGIFYASASEAISYPDEGEGKKAEALKVENLKTTNHEDASWFLHRNDCIRELVRSFPPRGHFGWHTRERVSALESIKMFAML